LKCPETQRWRHQVLNNEWPLISEKIALKKIFAVDNATEQRNLGTLAYKIKCKRENQVNKGKQVAGGVELDCM
jgi:hypothetical protein